MVTQAYIHRRGAGSEEGPAMVSGMLMLRFMASEIVELVMFPEATLPPLPPLGPALPASVRGIQRRRTFQKGKLCRLIVAKVKSCEVLPMERFIKLRGDGMVV